MQEPSIHESGDAVDRIIAGFESKLGHRTRPFGLLCRFAVRSEWAEEVASAFKETARRTKHEPGAIAFDVHRERQDRSRFVVHERWRSLDALDAHLRTPYVQALRSVIDDGLNEPPSFDLLDNVVERMASAQTLQIWHQVTIEGFPPEIFSALTIPRSISQWWIPDTRGECRVGSNLEFHLGNVCQVVQVVAQTENAFVRWDPVASGSSDDWKDTSISFELLPDGQATKVHLRHSGFLPSVKRFPYYSASWAVFLMSLKDLVETGQGHPFPNRWISG